MTTASGRLPARPGTYVLLLRNPRSVRVRAGSLGLCDFPRGWYLYTGSAFGPGGLAARIGRHLRPDKSCRWHIDYLTAALPVRRVWLTTSPLRAECAWADLLARLGGVPAVKGFGASDCTCAAHLFRFPARPALGRFRQGAGVPVQVVVTG